MTLVLYRLVSGMTFRNNGISRAPFKKLQFKDEGFFNKKGNTMKVLLPFISAFYLDDYLLNQPRNSVV